MVNWSQSMVDWWLLTVQSGSWFGWMMDDGQYNHTTYHLWWLFISNGVVLGNIPATACVLSPFVNTRNYVDQCDVNKHNWSLGWTSRIWNWGRVNPPVFWPTHRPTDHRHGSWFDVHHRLANGNQIWDMQLTTTVYAHFNMRIHQCLWAKVYKQLVP